jgi:glutamine synthetase
LDETDRNRTSPFPFTGTKFEFRAVGSSQNPSLPITVLNAIVAEALNHIVDEIEKEVLKKRKPREAALEVVRKTLKETRSIRFSGDNYSAAWQKEAKKRKLPIIEKSLPALDAFLEPSTVKVFEGILSKEELHARVEIMKQRYCKIMNIETRLLEESFQTQILPAAIEWQKNLADSIKSIGSGNPVARQKTLLKKIVCHLDSAMEKVEKLENTRRNALSEDLDKQAVAFCDRVAPQGKELRKEIDALELLLDDRLWPSPKYSEMLNIL